MVNVARSCMITMRNKGPGRLVLRWVLLKFHGESAARLRRPWLWLAYRGGNPHRPAWNERCGSGTAWIWRGDCAAGLSSDHARPGGGVRKPKKRDFARCVLNSRFNLDSPPPTNHTPRGPAEESGWEDMPTMPTIPTDSYCQMPADAYRCLHVPTDAYRCIQMPADAYRCRQMPTDAHRCPQMPTDAH